MKSKTIRKILSAKLEQFVNSIKDDSLKKLVEKNSIITGGCIASMLLKEPVNDYDFYFRTKEVAEAVAHYYVECFKSDFGGDIGWKVVVTDDRIKIVIPSAGVAGEVDSEAGSGDESEALLKEIEGADEIPASELDKKKPACRPVFLSANAISLSDKIQLIIRFFGEAEEIHMNYDFQHCMSYWTSWDGKLVLNPQALESLLARELRYVGSKYPLCSIIRTRKFVARGWTINAGQYLKMAMQLNELNLKDINVLEDQLTGVDAAYFRILIESLKDQEPDKINAAYISTIVDRIFG